MITSIAMRKPLMLAVLISLVAVLGSASATTALAAAPAPALAHAAVPWAKAGPGWTVVQNSTSTQVPADQDKGKLGRQTLYLVSPQGKKYAFYSWKPSPNRLLPFVIDWSGDRQRVLLKAQVTYSAPVLVEQVSLVTGKVIGAFHLPPEVEPIGYTKPDGLNLLAINEDGQLIRFDLQGHRQKVLGQADKFFPDALYTPEGTAVITSNSRGLEEVRNTGGIIKRWSAPKSVAGCEPVRWWAAGTVLARCFLKRAAPWRLWLFSLAGGRAKPLTSASISVPQEDGWRVGGKLYLNVVTGCEAIDQVGPGEFVQPLPVPGDAGAVIVGPASAGGSGGSSHRAGTARLLVLGQRKCNVGTSLFWFAPATRAIRYLFHATGDTVGVVGVVPFGQK